MNEVFAGAEHIGEIIRAAAVSLAAFLIMQGPRITAAVDSL
jgi:hypothetical protein